MSSVASTSTEKFIKAQFKGNTYSKIQDGGYAYMIKNELKDKWVGMFLATLIVVSVFSRVVASENSPSAGYTSDNEIDKVLGQILLCTDLKPKNPYIPYTGYYYQSHVIECYLSYILQIS